MGSDVASSWPAVVKYRGMSASATELLERAQRLRAAGHAASAERACRAALRALGRARTDVRASAARQARVELGEILESRGRFLEAARYFSAAAEDLRRAERLTREDRDVMWRAVLGAGRALQTAGRLSRANAIYQRALLAARGRGDTWARAAVLTAIGVLRKAQGRYADAMTSYRQALVIVRRRRDRADDMASLYHNLAGIAHARGDLRTAERLAMRGVGIRRRLRGVRATLMADLAALAPILDGLERRRETEALYKRVITFFRRHAGPHSYDVAVNVANLAALEYRTGRTRRAVRTFVHAVDLHRRVLGARHPELGQTIANFAVVLHATGAHRESLKMHRKALAIFDASVGKRHPYRTSCAANLRQALASSTTR